MTELKPMGALNVYLTPEFRKQVLSDVLEQKDALNPETRKQLFSILKDKLKISGFRSFINAPKGLTIRAMEGLFEKDSSFISSVLVSWAELAEAKTNTVNALLESLGFKLRTTDEAYADPDNSFSDGWPVGVTYESLFSKAIEHDKAFPLSSDELALLTIWKTGTLPGEFASETT